MKRARPLWLIGIVAYLVFMVVQLPAHTLWRLLSSYVQVPATIDDLNGLWWRGSARVEVPAYRELGYLNWQLKPAQIFLGRLGADLSYQSVTFKAKTVATFNPEGVAKLSHLTLHLNADVINEQLAASGVKLQGEFELRPTQAILDWRKQQIKSLKGELVWQGGRVQYRLSDQLRDAEVPILVGHIKTDNSRILVQVMTLKNEVVADGYLNPDGWAGIAIKQGLIALIDPSLTPSTTPDRVFFEVSEKVF